MNIESWCTVELEGRLLVEPNRKHFADSHVKTAFHEPKATNYGPRLKVYHAVEKHKEKRHFPQQASKAKIHLRK